MLNVVINNESVGKAYKKTNTILSKYLNQHGQKSFSGSISQEGLETLYYELKSGLSKYISICCILQKDKHLSEVLWILGNKNHFDEETGQYAMKTKSISVEYTSFNIREKYFSLLTQIAALLHDIGKNNKSFQEKLLNNNDENFEILRHEGVSAILFEKIIQKLVEKIDIIDIDKISYDINFFKEDFLSIIDYYNTLSKKTKYSEILAELQNDISRVKKTISIVEEKKQNKRRGVENKEASFYEKSLSAVLWIVLTHHKLISNKFSNQTNEEYFNINFDKYNFSEEKKLKKIQDNISFEKETVIFNDNNWVRILLEKLILLKKLVSEQDEKGNKKLNMERIDFISCLANLSRTTMILGDYIASITKSKKDNLLADKKKHIIANTNGDTKGDTLITHLKRTATASKEIHKLRKIALEKNNVFNKIENFQIRSFLEKKNDKFKWQDEASSFIKEKTKTQLLGNLVMMISETGSGKTIAGVKIMNAIQKDGLRFTLGLGLRTLTLQSGQAYKEALSLSDEKVAVIIGSSVVSKINQVNRGSSVLEEEEDFIIDVSLKNLKNSWINTLKTRDDLNDLSVINTNKIGKLVDTPIVVSTVDQFIKIVNLNRGSSLKMLARVFSSDLILDEIDSYSPQDLVELLKLIYLYAFYGRNVIVMSATINKVVLKKIKETYDSGFKVFSFLNQYDIKSQTFMVSNLIKSRMVSDHTEISNYLNDFSNYQHSEHFIPKLKVGNILNVSINSIDDWKQNIWNEARKLHNNYKDESGVSIGFIKFNTVASARVFAKYIFESSEKELNLTDSFQVSCLCYHSKYSLIELDNIESDLNLMVNRKNEKNAIENRRRKIRELRKKIYGDENSKGEIVILVSTTSILEVGRDHDYDFSILEPTSNRALIQASGRVLRHRMDKNLSNEGRVTVMSNMLKILTYTDKVWMNTGVFNYISKQNVKNYNEKLLTYNEMFGEVYKEKIISSEMFVDTSNKMRELEDLVYDKELNGLGEDKSLLQKFLAANFLTSEVYDARFRNNNQTKTVFISLLNNGDIDDISQNFESYYINGQEKEKNDVKFKKERVYLKILDLKKIFEKKYKKVLSEDEIRIIFSYEMRTYHKLGSLEEVQYHQLLGFNNK